jgi:hypothetical protein
VSAGTHNTPGVAPEVARCKEICVEMNPTQPRALLLWKHLLLHVAAHCVEPAVKGRSTWVRGYDHGGRTATCCAGESLVTKSRTWTWRALQAPDQSLPMLQQQGSGAQQVCGACPCWAHLASQLSPTIPTLLHNPVPRMGNGSEHSDVPIIFRELNTRCPPLTLQPAGCSC